MNEIAEHIDATGAADTLARVVRAPTLIQHLELKCTECIRNSGAAIPPAVCWIQLDQSQILRDQLGFTGLGKLLHAMHERIRAQLGATDLTARFGFDALGILLDAAGGKRDYKADAANMLKAINRNLFELEEHAVAATCSIAIAPALESLRPAEANLVQVARRAEQISTDGGNRWDVELERTHAGESSARLFHHLHEALTDNTIKVVSQPLLATSGEDIERIQILPRLEDSEGALITAANFVPIAAERGILQDLDAWMIRFAVRLLEHRNRAGDELPLLFVNQSAKLIDEPERIERLSAAIEGLEANQRRLVLEFNILDLKPRLKSARSALSQLKKAGFSISLTHVDEKVPKSVLLTHLPCDYLRMKANFARRLVDDDGLVERFGQFSKAMHDGGRKIIVPMLERSEEVAQIWKMDVDLIQGNFIQAAGDPVDTEESPE